MELLPALLERSRRSAQERIGKKYLHSLPYFELSSTPNKVFRDVGLSEMRRGMELIERPSLGDILEEGDGSTFEKFATNDSLCILQNNDGGVITYLVVYQSGLVFLASLFPEGDSVEKRLRQNDLSRFVFNSLEFLGQAYTNIGHPEAILDICMRIPNSDGVELIGLSGADSQPAVCRIVDVEVSKQRSAGDLEVGAASDTAAQFFAEICERFNAKLDSAALEEIKMQFSTEY